MESPLKRVLDYKLVFDSLCDSNGMVRLETLTARWPSNLLNDSGSKVPQCCLKHWSSCADKDGYLDWSSFSTGLQMALSEDAARISRLGKKGIPQSEAEKKLAALKLKGASVHSVPPLGKVTAADIEGFLSDCNRDVLMQALRKMRKEVYKGQMSVHRLTASNSPVKKPIDQEASGQANTSTSRSASGGKGGIVTRERDELTYGLEMLERTRKWYKERLKLLATEESHNSKEIKAEELLVVLERGTSTKSEMLQHLKEINSHLESLSFPAPNLTAEQQSRLQAQLQRLNESRQEKKSQAKRQQPVGPPPVHVGHAEIEFSLEDQTNSPNTIVVDPRPMPTFPVEVGNRPAHRSSSTTAVNRAGISNGTQYAYKPDDSRHSRPHYSSSQNISTLKSTHTQGQERATKPRRVPKRSHSFTSPSSQTTKCSDPQHELTSSVTDYPLHRTDRMRQYPLRGTASMQDLQPGDRVNRPTSKLPPQGPLSKSSSVRNVSGGHGNPAGLAPGIIHQQVYNSGISYSAQTLPTSTSSRSADRHRTHSHNPQHNRGNQSVTKGTEPHNVRTSSKDPPQRLGDSMQSLV